MKALITAIAAFWLLISCQNAKRVKTDEEVLTLIDSSGQTQVSPRELHVRITSLLADYKKFKEGFTITRIDYLPVKEGYAATIRYKLKNGKSGTYVVISKNNVDKLLLADGTAPVIAKEEKKSSRVVIICAGDCGCWITAKIDTETGKIIFSCSCATCIPLILYD